LFTVLSLIGAAIVALGATPFARSYNLMLIGKREYITTICMFCSLETSMLVFVITVFSLLLISFAISLSLMEILRLLYEPNLEASTHMSTLTRRGCSSICVSAVFFKVDYSSVLVLKVLL
jgi:hypothetical protein